MKWLAVVVLCLGVVCSPVFFIDTVFADTSVDVIDIFGEPVEVSTPVDEVDTESFSGFSKTIQRYQFNETVGTVTDVLDHTNGVQIRTIGGYGGYSSLSMRGSTGKQINVYIDGMLVNDAQSGSAELGLVPTSILERIELYPDFTPVQLSSANVGGAVNLITLDVFQPLREISIGAGSFGARRYALAIADTLMDWHFLLGADIENADNDYEIFNDQATNFNTDDDVFEPQKNADVEQQSLLLKAARRWGAYKKLEWLANIHQSDRAIPSVDNNQVNDATLESDYRRLQIKYNDRYGELNAGHRVYFSKNEQLYDDRTGSVGFGNEYAETDEKRWRLSTILSLDWLSHITSINIEYSEETVQQRNLITHELAINNQRDSVLVALQDDWLLMNNDLLFSAAIRHHTVNDTVKFNDDAVQGFYLSNISDVSDSVTSGSLGVTYQLSEFIKVKSNWAEQFRLPTLQERFGLQGLLIGNPELESEQAQKMDVGLVWQSPSLTVTLVAYIKHSDESIVYVYDSAGFGRAENSGESEIQGVQFDVGWQALDWLYVYGGTEQLDSETLSDVKSSQGKRLPGIYHDTWNAGADVSWRNWLLSVGYQWESDHYYNFSNNVLPDAKETMDASLRWVHPSWSLQLQARNVFDENYQDYNRFWGPGRAYYINLNVEI